MQDGHDQLLSPLGQLQQAADRDDDGSDAFHQLADPGSVRLAAAQFVVHAADIFERVAEEKLIQPTIIYEYPVEISPLGA